jgi:translation initiation factor IF-3
MDIATELLINEEIREREVRLIDENGGQLGVMPTQQALQLAEEKGLDLAMIQASAVPPVCKLLDYDKYRYEQAKRERENRKNQRVVDIKEVQLSATIEENDVNTKAKMAIRFLENGDKVKVSIRFRGRQITHSEIGLKVMQDFAERCKDVSMVEKRPALDGRNMIMILSPKATKASFAEKKAKRENAAAQAAKE